MRMKKLVSATAALTMAVSAFAGLATVASAADTYTVLYGNAVEEDGAVTGVTAQTDFDGENSIDTISHVYTDSSSNTTYSFIEGTALKGNAGTTKEFAEPVTTGKVYVNFSISALGGQSNLATLKDSSGNILVGSYVSLPSKSGDSTVAVIGGQNITVTAYNPRNVAYEINAVVDIDLNKIDYSVTAPSSGSSGSVKVVTVTTGSVNYTVNDVKGFYTNAISYNYAIDNLAVYSVTSDEKLDTIGYTVEFKDNNGIALKDAETRTTVAGTKVGLTADDAKNQYFGDDFYIYDAEASTEEETVDNEGVTLTAVYRKADTISYTVNDNLGNTITTGSDIETANITATYPRYVLKDGAAYIKGAISNEYNYKFALKSVAELNGTEQTETLEYTKSTADDATAVYYAEGEDIFTNNNVSNAKIRCSMGAGGDVTEQKTVVTLPAGKYKLTTAVWGGGKADSNQSTYTFTAGDTAIGDIKTTGSWKEVSFDEFTLTEETAVTVEKTVTGTSGACIDYVLIEKTGDVEVEEPVVPTEITVTKVSTNNDESKTGAAKAFKAVGKVGTNDIKNVKWSIEVTGKDAPATADIAANIASGTEFTYGLVVSAESVDISAISDTAEVIYE